MKAISGKVGGADAVEANVHAKHATYKFANTILLMIFVTKGYLRGG